MVKVTFTLDDETVERLRRIAAHLAKPQSQVVRQAIKEYEARADKLSDEERRRMLEAFDTFLAKVPPRPRHEVEAELAEIRASRRQGWREGPAKRRR
jgi:predicted transcriptional regulator